MNSSTTSTLDCSRKPCSMEPRPSEPPGLPRMGSPEPVVCKNLFLQTTGSGDPILGNPGGSEGLGSIEQGFLEQSNVDVVEEFIQMIVAQRSYEASSRVVQAADEMFQGVNNLAR